MESYGFFVVYTQSWITFIISTNEPITTKQLTARNWTIQYRKASLFCSAKFSFFRGNLTSFYFCSHIYTVNHAYFNTWLRAFTFRFWSLENKKNESLARQTIPLYGIYNRRTSTVTTNDPGVKSFIYWTAQMSHAKKGTADFIHLSLTYYAFGPKTWNTPL